MRQTRVNLAQALLSGIAGLRGQGGTPEGEVSLSLNPRFPREKARQGFDNVGFIGLRIAKVASGRR
jgi:hypothetical protein